MASILNELPIKLEQVNMCQNKRTITTGQNGTGTGDAEIISETVVKWEGLLRWWYLRKAWKIWTG